MPPDARACGSVDREGAGSIMTLRIPSIATVTDMQARFGTGASVQRALHRLLNSVTFFEWINIIALDRNHLRPLDPALSGRLSWRLATLADLDAMQADPRLDIRPFKFEYFRTGDSCLLSYADGKVAGYTWARTLGRAELVRGLVISVPERFLYNYDGLTLPEFRGRGLQPYRHHQLLNSGLWPDKRGLLGCRRISRRATAKPRAATARSARSGCLGAGATSLRCSRVRCADWASAVSERLTSAVRNGRVF